MTKNDLFEENDLFSASETPASSPKKDTQKQETTQEQNPTPAEPEKKTPKARTPKKKAEEQATPAEPSDQEETKSGKVTPASPKKINIESLVTSLRKNGTARLSEHETPTEADECEEENPGENEAQSVPLEPLKESAKEKAKKKILNLPEEERIAADALGKYLKDYLDERARKDPTFAKAYANPEKSLKECILYITAEVFKTRIEGNTAQISNEVVEGMALHYYQEPGVKVRGDRSNIAFAVMSEIEPLSEEDKRKISRMAMAEATEEYLQSEKKRIRQEIIDGKRTVKYSPEQQKALDEEARQQMVEESKKRQKRLTAKRAAAQTAAPTTEQISLF